MALCLKGILKVCRNKRLHIYLGLVILVKSIMTVYNNVQDTKAPLLKSGVTRTKSLDVGCHHPPQILTHAPDTATPSNILLLGFHGFNVYKKTKEFLENQHNVTLLTFTKREPSELKFLSNVLKGDTRRRFRMSTSLPQGETTVASNIIKTKKINQIHVVFDLEDFDPQFDARMLESTMDRCVRLLQTLSRDRKNKVLPVYIHVPDFENKRVDSGFHTRTSLKRRRLKNGGDLQDHAHKDGCDSRSSYRHIHNLFLEQIQLYTNVFKSIHKMDIKFVRI